MPFEEISNPRDFVPHLSDSVNLVFKLGNQRYFEPGPFCHKLADALRSRGVEIRTGASVVDVQSTRKPVVELSTGERLQADNVVIATGAWLPKLARRLGVRTRVQAGRGYSFSVDTGEKSIDYPVYLPAQRLACTPYRGRFRIAGTMEFRDADAAFDPKRVQSMIKHASEMFTGINFDDRQDEWVGSRPVTPDGLPLIGATKAPNVYVSGGHGMWGVVLGPASGRALAHLIETGETLPEIRDFDPLR
ncbi:NAD(P)/FAD-dependent oxidoreductase [Corynebacterium striatum]